MEECIGKGMEKWHGPSTSSQRAPLSSDLHVFTNPEVLQTLSSWGFVDISLYRHDSLNHWTLVIDSTSSSSPLPRGWGGMESSNHMVDSPSNQPPSRGTA